MHLGILVLGGTATGEATASRMQMFTTFVYTVVLLVSKMSKRSQAKDAPRRTLDAHVDVPTTTTDAEETQSRTECLVKNRGDQFQRSTVLVATDRNNSKIEEKV